MKNSEINLATLAEIFADEDKARAFLEAKRWPNGPVCPHCSHERAYALVSRKEGKRPMRPGVYKCAKCRKQFSVRVGTIFEESKIEIRKWLMAIHLMTSSKKGISAKQIEREVGVTYKTAWFICHRVREAMKQEPLNQMLLGGGGRTVEADETYVGGKAKNAHGNHIPKKTGVAVLVERGGRAIAQPMDAVTAPFLKSFIRANVDVDSKISTDDHAGYRGIGKPFKGGHSRVRHSRGEYVDFKTGDHTNTVESFHALLKRGHYGVFHQLSQKHLPRYCNEFVFRWNHRKLTDGERMVRAIEATKGKRLKYKAPTE